MSEVVERVPSAMPSNEKINVDTATQVEQLPQNADPFPKFDDMPSWKVGAILLSLGLSLFMFAIEQTSVATAVSTIGTALNIQGSISWIGTSYLLTSTIIQPVCGRAADAFGTKQLLLASLWIFIIGKIIAGTTSHQLSQIIIGRCISGIGGAGLLCFPCILISQLTHERQRTSYMNLINVVFIVTDALGPILGALFAQSGNWRWVFLFTTPLGPLVTLILLRFLHVPHSPHRISSLREALRLVDFMGMFWIIVALSFLVVALNLGGQSIAWNSPTMIGILTATAVSFLAFVISENYAALPIAPLNLFTKWKWRNVSMMMMTRTLLFCHMFAITFYLPILLQVIGFSTVSSAALVIPFLCLAGVSSTIANEVVRRVGHTRSFFFIPLAILPVSLGLMSTLIETSSLGKIIGYSLLVGLSFGPGTQLTMVIAQAGLPPDQLPTVTALIGSAPSLGGVIGVAVIGTVTSNAFRHSLSKSAFAKETSQLNLNDVVKSVFSTPPGPVRDAIVKAYVASWRMGCLALVGIAVAELLLCLPLRPVEFCDRGSRQPATQPSDEDKKGTLAA